jgi:PAS domain S-box-containing protein
MTDLGPRRRPSPGPTGQGGAEQNPSWRSAPLSPAVLDAVSVPVVVLDRRAHVRFANRTAVRLLARGGEALVGRPFWELVPSPKAREEARRLFEHLCGGEEGHQELDWVVQDEHGHSVTWTVCTAGVGDAHCIVVTGVDHSETRYMEDALRDSQARTQAILGAAVDAVVTIDEQGIIESVNPATERLFGYAAGELVGRNVKLLMPSPYREEHDEYLRRYRETDLPHIIGIGREVRGRHKDGSILPLDLAVSEVNLGGRRLFTGVLRDISERKRAEQEMSRMRLNLKSIIDSMPSILVGVDREGRITAWNQSAELITRVSAAAAAGHYFVDFFPEYAEHFEQLREAVRRHAPMTTKRIAHAVDGETRFADVMVYPLQDGGGSEGAVIRVDDVTERVRIEQMMVQTEKMMSLGGVAAGMAHEINNPLGAITQSCQNIVRRVSPALPRNEETAAAIGVDLGEVRRYLEAREILHFLDGIQDASARAAKIVSDMLTFARYSETHRAPTDLREVLDTAVRLAASDYDLKKRYDFKHFQVDREYDDHLPPVPCDRSAIEQVLLNLLKNAAQAITETGRAPHRIWLRTRREGTCARIEVEDNGPGMDEATRRRVFEPFFTTKPVGLGTGLGLSVSYFIVTEQHHGSMSVESSAGHGARFVIRLPLGKAR